MGSLEDDGGGVVRVYQAAAGDELETEAGLSELNRIEHARCVEELPSPPCAAGELEGPIGGEFGRAVLVVVDGHGCVGANDQLGGVERRVEFGSAGGCDGVVAAHAH